MEQLSFVFTVLFMLVGPVKIIPAYAALMRGAEPRLKRGVAVRGALIATALCAFLAFGGGRLIGGYHISVDAVRLSGGLVLLISALITIFRLQPPSTSADAPGTSAMQLAASPVAVPIIVPPAGIAAILLFMMLEPQNPGVSMAVAIVLAGIMVMDFLVMYFIDAIMRLPGLTIILTVIGSVLLFLQVTLAIEMALITLKKL